MHNPASNPSHVLTTSVAASTTTAPSGRWCRGTDGRGPYALDVEPLTMPAPPVPLGPRQYRSRIRRFGPLVGLLPPAALGLLALLLHRGSSSALQGVASFLFAVLAAPCLLVAGVPLSSGAGTYLVAIVASGAIWLVLSTIASRRATRTPVASWRDFWREYCWLVGAVWVGVGGALLVVDLMLGRPVV